LHRWLNVAHVVFDFRCNRSADCFTAAERQWIVCVFVYVYVALHRIIAGSAVCNCLPQLGVQEIERARATAEPHTAPSVHKGVKSRRGAAGKKLDNSADSSGAEDHVPANGAAAAAPATTAGDPVPNSASPPKPSTLSTTPGQPSGKPGPGKPPIGAGVALPPVVAPKRDSDEDDSDREAKSSDDDSDASPPAKKPSSLRRPGPAKGATAVKRGGNSGATSDADETKDSDDDDDDKDSDDESAVEKASIKSELPVDDDDDSDHDSDASDPPARGTGDEEQPDFLRSRRKPMKPASKGCCVIS
jgi:hypothetical protein